MPSIFSDSDIDKFLNYNNITHKLRDTHQARNYHPYHYYYYYYYYTVFWCWEGDYSNGEKKEMIICSLSKCAEKKSGCNNNSNNNNIIIFIIVCTENSLQSIQSKLPKLSWHSGNSRGSIMKCTCVFLCVCLHVTSCSYCKSGVQSLRDIPVVTVRGRSEVRFIVDVLMFCHLLAQAGTLQRLRFEPQTTELAALRLLLCIFGAFK